MVPGMEPASAGSSDSKTCGTCGSLFRPVIGQQRYCQPGCRASERRHPDDRCPVCGVTFPHARNKRFCSDRCRYVAKVRPEQQCPACLRAFRPSGRYVTYCGRGCIPGRSRAPTLAAWPPVVGHEPSCRVYMRACDQCARLFVSYLGVAKRCSVECLRLATNANVRAAYHDPARPHRRRSADLSRHRRRAALKGVEVRPYADGDIYQRDGWRCHLCGRAIERRRAWPHPMSKSIDHLVPISMGGADVPENVAAAHLRCNMSRGNRGVAQLRWTA